MEPLEGSQMPRRPNELTTYQQFLKMLHSMPDGDACLVWPFGKISTGYGATLVLGKMRTVHRLAWEIVKGPIPEGLFVLHHCDNRPCFRVDHLFLGTNADNIRDRVNKGRFVKGSRVHKQPLRGLAVGERHPFSKLTDESVQEIRRRFHAGETYSQLLREYPVRRQSLMAVVKRHTWKHI
jgi:hypothetical protein